MPRLPLKNKLLKINKKQLYQQSFFNFSLNFKNCFLVILPAKFLTLSYSTGILMRLSEKYRPAKLKIILLLAVYVFVSLTNLFFVERYTRNITSSTHYSLVAKRNVKSFFRLPKAASTTFNQNQTQYNEINQKAALFFVVLLFTPGLLVIKKKLFPHSNQLIPDYQYAFLRYRSIQI